MRSILNILPTSDTTVYDLTTLDDVVATLGLEALDSASLDDIENQITLQSKLVASLCGRVFASQDVLETFWIDSTSIEVPLFLRRYPVSQVDLVAVDNVELVADDDYQLDKERGLLWFTNTLRNARKISVTYTGGYELPDAAPAALAQAVIELIREQRRRASLTASDGTDLSNVRATQHGDTRVEYAITSNSSTSSSSSSGGGVPLTVQGLIEQFRAPAV